ncbi:MAG: hypothetical protein KDD64_11810 [Bdellovibrionales bacterium]|nr:hypothetical protein [Bdellovibrionales bacterium]
MANFSVAAAAATAAIGIGATTSSAEADLSDARMSPPNGSQVEHQPDGQDSLGMLAAIEAGLDGSTPGSPPATTQPGASASSQPTRGAARTLAVEGLPAGLAPTRTITDPQAIQAMDAFASMGGKIEYFKQGYVEQLRLNLNNEQRVVTVRSGEDFDAQLKRALQDFAVQTTAGGLPGSSTISADQTNLSSLSPQQLVEYIDRMERENSALEFRADLLQKAVKSFDSPVKAQIKAIDGQIEAARVAGNDKLVAQLETLLAARQATLETQAKQQFGRFITSTTQSLERFDGVVSNEGRTFTSGILPGSEFLAQLEKSNAFAQVALRNLENQRLGQAARITNPRTGDGLLPALLREQANLASRVRNTEGGIDVLDDVFIKVGDATVDYPNAKRQRSAREAIEINYQDVIDGTIQNGIPSRANELYGDILLQSVTNDQKYRTAQDELGKGLSNLPSEELLRRAQNLQEDRALFASQISETETELAQSPFYTATEQRDLQTMMQRFDRSASDYDARVTRALKRRDELTTGLETEIGKFERVGAALTVINQERNFLRLASGEWNTYLANRNRTLTGKAQQQTRRGVEDAIGDWIKWGTDQIPRPR